MFDGVAYDTKSGETPTAQHQALQVAFDFFNARLFGNRLPPCMITLQRGRRFHGYHWTGAFQRRDSNAAVDEIAMNPETMNRDTRVVLSTLAHEMVHHRQQHEGKPSRNGYHNAQWARWMEEIGLVPSDTGQPGGKKTGQRVTHYIQDGGPFAQAAADLIASSWRLDWHALPKAPGTSKSDRSKVKHTCPECGLNAWAKEGAALICGRCRVDMLPEEQENDQ